MKPLSNLIVSAGICTMLACGSGTGNKDSVDSAKNANDSTMNAMGDSAKMGGADTTANAGTKYSPGPVDKSDADFAVDAANGGMTEVAASQLAQSNATNDRIKSFANMMVQDHTKAGDQLKQLAAAKSIALPATISDKNQKKVDALGKKTGKDFDKAYVNMMLDDHKSAVNMFQKESNNAKDNDIKTWATQTLPTLQMHLDSIQAITGKH